MNSLTSGLEAGVEGARPPFVVPMASVDLVQSPVRPPAASEGFSRQRREPVGSVDREVGDALLWPVASPVVKIICERIITSRMIED